MREILELTDNVGSIDAVAVFIQASAPRFNGPPSLEVRDDSTVVSYGDGVVHRRYVVTMRGIPA